MRPQRHHYLLIAQLSISGLLLACLIFFAHPADLIAAARHVPPLALLVTFALLMLANGIAVLRQWTILRTLGIDISLGRMAVLNWFGLFANNFLPSSVGGDATIAAALHRRYRRLGPIVTGLLLNRIIGLIALLIVLLILLLVVDLGSLQSLINQLIWWCVALLAASAIGILAMMLVLKSENRFARLIAALLAKMQILGATALSIGRTSMRVLQLSFIITMLVAIAAALLAQWQYPAAGFWSIATIFLMLQLVQLIPISFNGIGMAESVAAYCLTRIGWPLQEAVLFSLILRCLTIAISLPGALAFLILPAKAEASAE